MSAQNIAAPQSPVLEARQGNRAWQIVLWVLQIGLVAQFALAGFSKVAANPAMVDMFAEIGAGQWLRVLTGALELAGAVGLLIPALSGLAALGLAAVMVGATITNVFILETNTTITIVLLLVAAVVAWGRRERTLELASRLRR